MKHIEQGILIHRAPYSETSLLVTVLCSRLGLTTFLFQGGKKKHGNILYPMALIEFSYFRRNDSSLGKISEAHLATAHPGIPFDPVKSGIAFFMAELVKRTVRSDHSEERLFQALVHEIRWLEVSQELTNYPLWLLAFFSRESGIVPAVETKNPVVFDLTGGRLQQLRPNHVQYLEGNWIHWFENMLLDTKTDFLSLKIPRDERLKCLEAWLSYFAVQLHSAKPLQSIAIIREVLA